MKQISIDRIGEKLVRRLAGHTSRRGLLSRVGLALVEAHLQRGSHVVGTVRSSSSNRSGADSQSTHRYARRVR